MSPPSQQNWAVIGGGMLGMTLAQRLSQHGQQVTLYEAGDELGGLASAWQLGDVLWDRHYHVTLMSDTYTRNLLAELDLESDMNWVETKTGFFTDGKHYSMSNSLEFLRFPPLNLIQKFRLGATIFRASKIKNWKPLEGILVADWLRRWSGHATFEKIWLPLLRAKLGDNYKKTSAAFIWATIARMYAARRTGLKKEMFGYVRGGYARILKRFGETLSENGVAIRLGQHVEHIESNGNAPVSVRLPDGIVEEYDRVVLSVPSPVIGRCCPDLAVEELDRWQQIEYQGIICASLLLKKPLKGFYVTNITDSWVPFTAVIEMSALVDRNEFNGNSLVYLPKYVAADDAAFEVTDDEYREQFLTALEKMYPEFDRSDVLSFRVSRVRNVMALSALNYSDRLPPMRTSLPGVFAVNSAHIVNGTLNVNETIRLAEEAFVNELEPELTKVVSRETPCAVASDQS